MGDSIEPDGWRLWYESTNLDRDDGYEKEYDSDVIQRIKQKYALARNFVQSLDV